jgi:hypothetical protein
MRRLLLLCAGAVLLAGASAGQELRVPPSVSAGEDATISTAGSGQATFYVVGPGVASKSSVNLGEEIQLHGQDLRNAGHYMAIVCSSTCQSASFYVIAAKPTNLSFLVHPSRVPVGQENAVSGVALPFDTFHNLVLSPAEVNFTMNAANAALFSRSVHMQQGIGWFRTSSGKTAGTVRVVASVADLSARRAVQQVASDPCNLRMQGQRTAKGITVQTEPVRDCSGNPVSDGTIVSFGAVTANGRSTVDAPIKHGVARAQIEGSGAAVVSVASGVVIGNELHIGAQQ